MVLLAPSWHAMQERLCILDRHCHALDIACNTKKTVCMLCLTISEKLLHGVKLEFVEQSRHLKNILCNSLNDDVDIQETHQEMR